MARLTIRIDLGKGGALGPGKIRLLELIQSHGSISEAGRVMGMSYRQAWLLVDSLNQSFRQALVSKQAPQGAASVREALQKLEHRLDAETGTLATLEPWIEKFRSDHLALAADGVGTPVGQS